jgi:hypothetical protein
MPGTSFMRARDVRCRFAVTAFALAMGVGPLARADAQPAAGAAELLDAEATSLMQQHRYAEACPKLAQSDRLHPGTGVLLRLGLCYELSGKTASAWSTFREAAGRARHAGDEAVAQLATKRAGALEPRLIKVTLQLAPGLEPAGVTVRCDGITLDRSAIGAPIPLDPGNHTVEASMPGRPPFRRTLVVAEGDAPATLAVDLGAAPASSAAAVTGPDGSDAAPRGSTQRTMALVAGGVGVVGIVVGTIFGALAMSNWNRARSECTSGFSGCSPDALSLEPVVKSDALWSTVGFAVGAAGFVGGAVLWWTAPRTARAESSGYIVAPAVDGHRFGVDLEGRF